MTVASASKSLKIEKKAKSQLGKEKLLHSTQEPNVQAFTEQQHAEGSLENNSMQTGCNNIFNSLSEKKKELNQGNHHHNTNNVLHHGLLDGNSCLEIMLNATK